LRQRNQIGTEQNLGIAANVVLAFLKINGLAFASLFAVFIRS